MFGEPAHADGSSLAVSNPLTAPFSEENLGIIGKYNSPEVLSNFHVGWNASKFIPFNFGRTAWAQATRSSLSLFCAVEDTEPWCTFFT
jgi:hypothetical protein